MDLFGDWIATENGMLSTLLALIESAEIVHIRTHPALIAAIEDMLRAGQASGELRTGVTAEDVAALPVGTFTVAPLPEHSARADRLLNIVMHGLRATTGHLISGLADRDHPKKVDDRDDEQQHSISGRPQGPAAVAVP